MKNLGAYFQYIGLLAFAAVAILVGGWLGLNYQKVSFNKLPGVYQCGSFGLPTREQNTIMINGEHRVFSKSPSGDSTALGILQNYDSYRGRLELDRDVVHRQDLSINPLDKNFFEGTSVGLKVIAKTGDKESQIAFCEKRM